MIRAVRTPLVIALCSAVLLGGCGGKPTVSEKDLEQGVADALQRSVGQRPDSVDCPGPIEATPGQTARCVLTAGTTRYGLTVTITDYRSGKATYDVQVDNAPLPSSA